MSIDWERPARELKESLTLQNAMWPQDGLKDIPSEEWGFTGVHLSGDVRTDYSGLFPTVCVALDVGGVWVHCWIPLARFSEKERVTYRWVSPDKYAHLPEAINSDVSPDAIGAVLKITTHPDGTQDLELIEVDDDE